MTSGIAVIDGLVGLRAARECEAPLSAFADHYRAAGLLEKASFEGHNGYDGVIFRLPGHAPVWTEFEVTTGPGHPPAHSGWLVAPLDLAHPPGTSGASPHDDRFWFRRDTASLADALLPYALLGFEVVQSGDEATVRVGQCVLQMREVAAESFLPPAPDDMVALFFDGGATRDRAGAALRERLVAVEHPNPWWRRRAHCFADADGFTVAAATMQPMP